ncbi:MAG: DMT family transporter [Proteobacteria bacterium]|nr:DMT family transporter [Pseudomonadota bacterium]MBU1583592.1 DMT family transporter [Pseudomonadota bacterium]MBU2452483.1 DMT family transporter [Pseudomonadota bacterium]MBU2628662.1 DMT family transporter [Pseudomonadota bacterium]
MMKNSAKQAYAALRTVFFSPYMALTCAALLWSGNFIAGRALKGDIPPIQLNFWRWVIALIVLIPLSHKQILRHKAIIKSEWKIITALGFTGIACFHICVYTALTTTTAINALIILSTSPMAIVLIARLFFKEPIRVSQTIGILVSLVGAVTLICHGNPLALQNFNFNSGDIWMLIAVPMWAVYAILLKQQNRQLPQIVLLTSTVTAGLAMMIPFYMTSLFMEPEISINVSSLLGLLYISLFASVLAFLFWNHGVSIIGPVKAGMYIHLMPVFGSFLSIIILNEGMATYHIIGATFILAGIVLCNLKKISTDSKYLLMDENLVQKLHHHLSKMKRYPF